MGNRARYGAPVPDEPVPAQYRGDGRRAAGNAHGQPDFGLGQEVRLCADQSPLGAYAKAILDRAWDEAPAKDPRYFLDSLEQFMDRPDFNRTLLTVASHKSMEIVRARAIKRPPRRGRRGDAASDMEATD